LRCYFNVSYLERELKRGKRIINNALLKHGYANFSLEILEYCDKSDVVSKEQYYLDLLSPQYNMCKYAGSFLGFKHSKETREKISAAIKGRKHTEETIAKIKAIGLTPEQKVKHLEHLSRLNSSQEAQDRLKILNTSQEHRERLLKNSLSRAKSVEVLDTLNNEVTIYSSTREAARAIGCSFSYVARSLRQLKEHEVYKLINKRYKVKLANEGGSNPPST
jgi:group I intron endonuclease